MVADGVQSSGGWKPAQVLLGLVFMLMKGEGAGSLERAVPDQAPAQESPAAPDETPAQGPEPGFHWHRFVQRIQDRKQWAARGHMLNYSKNGMPQSVDGRARGLGSHLGRWGWREIRPHW